MTVEELTRTIIVTCPYCHQKGVQCYTLKGQTRMSAHHGNPAKSGKCLGSDQVVSVK